MLRPLVLIIVFAIVGNSYEVRNLQAVWYAGCCLEAVAGLASLGFSERYRIPHEAEEDSAVEGSEAERSGYEGPKDNTTGLDNGGGDKRDEGCVDESTRELQRKIDRVLVDEEGAAQNDHGIAPKQSPHQLPRSD